jgi:uncharacterized YccA/Bax inhibitor family protein
MIKSGNPALKSNTFSIPSVSSGPIGTDSSGGVMTLQGTVNKSLLLLLFLLVPALYTWNKHFMGETGFVQIAMIGGGIAGFICAITLFFKKAWAPVLAPIYAVLQGLMLGGLSAFFEQRFPGIVIQAVGLTFGVFAALLFAYKSKLIQATENFKLGIAAATGGVMLVYMVGFIMSFFGSGIPMIHENGIVGIGFSLVVVVIAALNLVMDFDFIEEGAEQGAPKYMEWYGAFGLLVTLCWLYLEMLRLLAKLQSRD